jgi:hypothetical protein
MSKQFQHSAHAQQLKKKGPRERKGTASKELTQRCLAQGSANNNFPMSYLIIAMQNFIVL